jgi:protein subunit release factor B
MEKPSVEGLDSKADQEIRFEDGLKSIPLQVEGMKTPHTSKVNNYSHRLIRTS